MTAALPTDDLTEKLILGFALLDPGSMDTLRTTVAPDDFSTQRHRDIWAAICASYDAGAGTDAVHVYTRLSDIGKSHDGLSYLTSLTDGVPIIGVDHDLERLKEIATLRRLAVIGDALANRACGGLESSQELQEWLLQAAQDLTCRASDRIPISTRDLVDRIGMQQLLMPQRQKTGLRLPWKHLQSAIGGLRGGQMVVVAAYTSRGKSSLACQIATHCTRQSTGVFYWTTEMTPEALFRRMVDQMSGIDGLRHREASLTQAEIGRARDAVGWLYEHPVWFDRHSRSMPSMIASLRQVRARHEIGLVVVDHLQHVKGARADSRAREVSEISRSLKLGAIDFDLPFLVVSQVSRPKESEQSLSIHMLKESGDVENDADVILLLNSPKPAGLAPVPVNLHVAKQREGPAGFDIPLVFRPSSQTFESTEDA